MSRRLLEMCPSRHPPRNPHPYSRPTIQKVPCQHNPSLHRTLETAYQWRKPRRPGLSQNTGNRWHGRSPLPSTNRLSKPMPRSRRRSSRSSRLAITWNNNLLLLPLILLLNRRSRIVVVRLDRPASVPLRKRSAGVVIKSSAGNRYLFLDLGQWLDYLRLVTRSWGVVVASLTEVLVILWPWFSDSIHRGFRTLHWRCSTDGIGMTSRSSTNLTLAGLPGGSSFEPPLALVSGGCFLPQPCVETSEGSWRGGHGALGTGGLSRGSHLVSLAGRWRLCNRRTACCSRRSGERTLSSWGPCLASRSFKFPYSRRPCLLQRAFYEILERFPSLLPSPIITLSGATTKPTGSVSRRRVLLPPGLCSRTGIGTGISLGSEIPNACINGMRRQLVRRSSMSTASLRYP